MGRQHDAFALEGVRDFDTGLTGVFRICSCLPQRHHHVLDSSQDRWRSIRRAAHAGVISRVTKDVHRHPVSYDHRCIQTHDFDGILHNSPDTREFIILNDISRRPSSLR